MISSPTASAVEEGQGQDQAKLSVAPEVEGKAA